MTIRRELVIWVAAAFGATTLLTAAIIWRQRNDQARWSTFMVGVPHRGAQLFYGSAACAHCHSINGVGGDLAPDLGYSETAPDGLNQLVSAMWNHAPRMWERIATEKISYPDLRSEEIAHLFAFLYTVRHVDERGNTEEGQRLFQVKGCARCHAMGGQGGGIGPDLAATQGVDTPIRWTQAMWNHFPAMEKRVEEMHIPWPRFEGREMNDLLAYIRAHCGGERHEAELFPASPERGKKIFETKSCIQCHSVQGKGGHVGPDLGTAERPSLTIVKFAGLMWNHSPDTWRLSQARSISRPKLEGQDIADLVAYFASLQYFEPVGSPAVGEALFAERGCAYCHGNLAQGTHDAPTLRQHGAHATIISLATSLWQHGPKMYERTRKLGRPWPMLDEDDVGDLVAFLNTPPDTTH